MMSPSNFAERTPQGTADLLVSLPNAPLRDRMLRALWPSFLVAGVGEIAFFSLINPRDLVWFWQQMELSEHAIHALGFFFFWALAYAGSVLSLWLAGEPERPAAF